MLTAYLLLYIYYLHRGFVLLRSRPYNSFRVGNVLVRLQVGAPWVKAQGVTGFITAFDT